MIRALDFRETVDQPLPTVVREFSPCRPDFTNRRDKITIRHMEFRSTRQHLHYNLNPCLLTTSLLARKNVRKKTPFVMTNC
ncbi:hypothetical protein WI61_26030 [Burkholderia cepacia]|nr:hypothetical protein WI48_14325 [Burkholderia cepacia]KVA69835.1 hypothetical protein WI49_06250 [Burkholderia cepacia]KVA89947.1 hypothetical protein WI50_09875 [Burkholderia cepacia]KVA92790.1 hypothetical protein WI52_03900 [Burkholderia cepacia]KVA94005.1 hypothetical protein WI51_04305 [Burkholderia cepacia]